jgi:uncharacterized membrane protein
MAPRRSAAAGDESSFWKAHTDQVGEHRRIMIFLFSGALVIAGLFTILPGRIMHRVLFGA